VADKAESIAHLVGDDGLALVCAAWLHDVGYSPGLNTSGMHPLDGARYLRDVARADGVVCRLVAHHSFSVIEARTRGLAGQLTSEFPEVEGLVSDALTYADMTTSPDGDAVDVNQRLAEIIARYGNGDLVAESIRQASPQIRGSVRMVTALLTAT
jgi:predicted hydrolase (HD superfamily)